MTHTHRCKPASAQDTRARRQVPRQQTGDKSQPFPSIFFIFLFSSMSIPAALNPFGTITQLKLKKKNKGGEEQAHSPKFLVLALWEGRWEDRGKIRKAQISNGSSIFSLVPVTSLQGCIKNQSVQTDLRLWWIHRDLLAPLKSTSKEQPNQQTCSAELVT